MSESRTKPDEVHLEKSVTLVGYSEKNTWASLKEFAGAVSGLDMDETRTDEEEYYLFRIDLGPDNTIEEKMDTWMVDSNHEKTANEIIQAFNGVHKNVTFRKETKVTETKVNSINKAGREVRDIICETLPQKILGGKLEKRFIWSYQNEINQTKVRVSKASFDKRRVLAKEADREDDDLYETLSQRPSVMFNIELEADSEEELDEMTEAVVKELHKNLSRLKHIGKVRYMDCTITTEKKGDCYNI